MEHFDYLEPNLKITVGIFDKELIVELYGTEYDISGMVSDDIWRLEDKSILGGYPIDPYDNWFTRCKICMIVRSFITSIDFRIDTENITL